MTVRGNLGARVLGLLRADRVDVRCAAAVALGAAGRGDPDVQRALIATLADDNPLVRRMVLDALAEVGARGLAPQLAPLLDSGDEEVRSRALALLAAQGAGGEPALRKALGVGPPSARREVARLLVARGSDAALGALLDRLGDHDLGEHVLQLLRAELDRGEGGIRAACSKRAVADLLELDRAAASPRGKAAAAKAAGARAAAKAEAAAARAAAKAGGKEAKAGKGAAPAPPPAPDAGHDHAAIAHTAGLLRLIGYVADPATLPILVDHAAPQRPAPIRHAAMAAMRRIVSAPEAKKTEPALAQLIDCALGPDAALAASAVQTLRGARIPDGMAKRFAALADAPHPEARQLALDRMPSLGGSRAVQTLLAHLAGDEPGPREAAARALAATPEAAGPLVKALATASDEGYARRLARALRAHEGRLPPAAHAALVDAARGRIGRDGDPVGAVVLEALGHLDAGAHAALLFERAQGLRKQGKPAEAFAALRPLLQLQAPLDDDQRFLLGVLGLEAAGKDLLRAARSADPVLRQFAELVGRGYPVAKSLARQSDLDLDDLFTLGFNFVESSDEDEKQLGADLLETVAERQPRGKLGMAARNKLRLRGLG